MNAEQYLNEALGGNMNIGTLKPLAWHEIMEGYARHKLAEALKPSHNTGSPKLPTRKQFITWLSTFESAPSAMSVYEWLCRQLRAGA